MGVAYRDPIAASFRLLENYKASVYNTLLVSGLSANDASQVLMSLELDRGLYFSINPRYRTTGVSLRKLCIDEGLAPDLPNCFPCLDKGLYEHQAAAIRSINTGRSTVIATGTGSGKTEAFLIPIIDFCLKHPGSGVKAIIIYPMNSLANDQLRRIAEATKDTGISFGIFTGATPEDPSANSGVDAVEPLTANQRVTRHDIRVNPPDILITNHVMLDWMLTRDKDKNIFVQSADTLKFVVLDEVHVYRGNKATHLAHLLRRLKTHLRRDDIVHIGSSATLSNDPGAIEEVKRDFLLPLLGVTDCALIQPVYSDDTPPATRPLPSNLAQALLDDKFDIARDAAQCNLKALTGQNFPYLYKPEPYQALRENEFVEAMRRAMLERHSQSFLDLVRILESVQPALTTSGRSELIVKAFLSTICYLNEARPSGIEPILDFRTHLFVQNVGGNLKCCLRCQRYHSGNQTYCQECGSPLFCVYAGDIHKCVGRVVNNRLTFELEREPNRDGKEGKQASSIYVLISTNEDTTISDETLRFGGDWRLENDGIALQHSPEGSLLLEPMQPDSKSVKAHLIGLVASQKDYQHLHALVDAALDLWGTGNQKLLGFVDSRERASRYASILRDEFASEFMEAYLRWKYPREMSLDLERTPALLRQEWEQDREKLPEYARPIFEELNLWFYRLTGIPERIGDVQSELLKLKLDEALADISQDLLGVFLQERAIRKPDLGDIHGRFIKFQTYLAKTKRGIHVESGQVSESRNHTSISLANQGREYAELIAKYGADAIRAAIEHDLLDDGWLCCQKTPDDKTHYYLEPSRVVMNLAEADVNNAGELAGRYLRIAELHSSELTATQRRKVEAGFIEGAIQFLLATPTLEMGIDIGALQSVLMVGVPPTPANYAQRAGRAGRRGNFALIVTFCEDDDDHDAYYFRNPKLMIDGLIAPPHFNLANPDVIQKHVNALVLAENSASQKRIKAFLSSYEFHVEDYARQAEYVFGDCYPEVGTYVRDKLAPNLCQFLLTIEKQGNTQQALYLHGFFPDYGFRRDQVLLIDQAAYERNKAPETSITDFALSEREPEMAFRHFVPGSRRFVAGDVYEITENGQYETIGTFNGKRVRSYRYMFARLHNGHASKDSQNSRSVLRRQFKIDRPYLDKDHVLQVAFDPSCRLQMRSLCVVEADNGPKELEFALGYDLVRNAIVLAFERSVCADIQLIPSVLSALEYTIRRRYRLDSSELRATMEYRPASDTDQITDDSKLYAVLYDFDGNGNVPLDRIHAEFDQVISESYARLHACDCAFGCYDCLYSYSTHFYRALQSKRLAHMFLGYLSGHEYFVPSIEPFGLSAKSPDLILTVTQSGSHFVVGVNGRRYENEWGSGNYNTSLFSLVTRVIRSEFREGMENLCIRSKFPWFVEAINGEGKIKKDDQTAFGYLQFHLLRFRSIRAEGV